MSEYTKVTAESMQLGIDSLRKAQTSFQSCLEVLKTQLEASLAQWDGPAQNAYWQTKQIWERSAIHMEQVIGKMRLVLQQITENYQATEQAITNCWS